ncbi:MAG: hypothetical protein CENE_00878 [Candidatus Celerinatantimonas neptuna]|nr:MAG: hypothetical protein CENE_00878 [Candidatus Celerinatantimonas neptuna]
MVLGLWVISITGFTAPLSPLWKNVPGFKSVDVKGKPIATLWLKEQTAKKTGTVILLPDWGRLPTSDDVINPLRKKLPEWGWQTIAIAPPLPQNKNSIISNSNPKAIKAYQQKLIGALQTINQSQNEVFGYQVVIAQGVMAAWMIRIYQQQLLPLPDALIIVDSYFPNMETNQKIAGDLAKLTCPVYDIYFRDANRWALADVKARRIAMVRAQKIDYRQSEIQSDPFLSNSGLLLAKRVYGWFNSLGWY